MKRLILKIGFFLATFLVLNVGMFFLLKLTQPVTTDHAEGAHADSSTMHLADSNLVHDDVEFDHAPDAAEDSLIPERTKDVAGHVELEIASGAHPDSANVVSTDESVRLGSDTTDADKEHANESSENDLEQGVALSDIPKSSVEIAKLAKVLEGMKPTEAAIIAERLPTETIVELVMRMKSRNGAKMMASLPVPVAASVATRMAELSGVRKPS